MTTTYDEAAATDAVLAGMAILTGAVLLTLIMPVYMPVWMFCQARDLVTTMRKRMTND